jgi:hypothetical protein
MPSAVSVPSESSAALLLRAALRAARRYRFIWLDVWPVRSETQVSLCPAARDSVTNVPRRSCTLNRPRFTPVGEHVKAQKFEQPGRPRARRAA